MFKKPAQIKPSSNIKTSERKKLLSIIGDTYSIQLDEVPKEEIEKILPPTIKKASFVNFEKVSGSIYFDENEIPVWFHTRDSEIYPTIFTLMKYPTILPTIKTHPHVLGILTKGADLMLPGTIPPFDPRATKGAIVGVVSHEEPEKVTAIGHCKLNLPQFDSVIGRSGVAVEVIHHLHDTLLEKKDLKVPEPKPVGQEEKKDETEKAGSPLPAPLKKQNDFPELTTEDIDNLFIKSLKSIGNIELPTPASTFMSYVNKGVPSSLNIKKTSWKKASKFLKEMAKQNLIKVKGKDEDLTVLQLNTGNPNGAEGAPAPAPTPAPKPKAKSSSSSTTTALKVIPLYKPTKNIRAFFNKLDDAQYEFDACYTAAQVRGLVEAYIKKFSLVAADPKMVKPDAELYNKEESTREQVFKNFLTKFSPYYRINDSDVHKGTPPKIEIVTELKIGRKVVTRVSNFETFDIKIENLAKELRNKCSGSSTIVDNDVQVQGPHGKLIIDLLKDKGVPVSYINFEDKTKKKKNKK
ncbi:Translation machinery-associated protein 64 [Candida viswanathii]|uniref:Translation machinery-associated protein 64 n=1 Tax=Candida viswanathii TaxID=5486 RepID=A0A367XTB1_9ASCO|nr:Translation machinery-associated protein 64 [Candida viswanathii]